MAAGDNTHLLDKGFPCGGVDGYVGLTDLVEAQLHIGPDARGNRTARDNFKFIGPASRERNRILDIAAAPDVPSACGCPAGGFGRHGLGLKGCGKRLNSRYG